MNVRESLKKAGGRKMDFAEILNQWEDSKASQKNKSEKPCVQTSGKKANAPEKPCGGLCGQNEKRINPTELWLRRYGTVDKDALRENDMERRKFHSRTYLEKLKADATVDLHGLNRDQAWSRLDSFVGECAARGFKKIMIVHGKGIHTKGTDPVLGETVRRFIEADGRLGTSGNPDLSQGGKGSTWVIIKHNV